MIGIKMKKILLFASIIACLCACQTEVTTPIYTYSVTAYAEAETRTALDAEDHVVWKTGDQLALVMGSAVATFTLDANQDGQRYGTFSYTGSQLADDTYMAYYPASVVADDGTFTWPTLQVYSEDQCKNAPMLATGISVSSNALSELRFTNMGGLLQLTLSGNETVQEITRLLPPTTIWRLRRVSTRMSILRLPMPMATWRSKTANDRSPSRRAGFWR